MTHFTITLCLCDFVVMNNFGVIFLLKIIIFFIKFIHSQTYSRNYFLN